MITKRNVFIGVFAFSLCSHHLLAVQLDPIDWLNDLNRVTWSIFLGKTPSVRSTSSNTHFTQHRNTMHNQIRRNKQNDHWNRLFEEPGNTDQPDLTRTQQPPPAPHEEAEPEEPKVMFSDIAGLDKVLAQIKQIVDYLRNPQKYKNLGAKVPKGVLLEGPPGVGKTMIAKAIANEAGCNFLYASGSEFVEIYVGQGASRIRQLFKQARAAGPAIVFIDEIDAIGAKRSGSGGGSREYDQTLNQLLVEMQGFKENDSVIVIAATNRADILDGALKRPGRFTQILSVPKPDAKARKEILTHYIDKLPRVDTSELDLDDVVKKTGDFSGAEIEDLINKAALEAVARDAQKVTAEHILSALKQAIRVKRVRSSHADHKQYFV